jgi:hypothetical protein
MSALFKSLPSAPDPDGLQNQPGLSTTAPPAPDAGSGQNEPSLANDVNPADNPLHAWAQHVPEADDEADDNDAQGLGPYLSYDQLQRGTDLPQDQSAPDRNPDLNSIRPPVSNCKRASAKMARAYKISFLDRRIRRQLAPPRPI